MTAALYVQAVYLARWLREHLGCPHAAYEAEVIAWKDFDAEEWT